MTTASTLNINTKTPASGGGGSSVIGGGATLQSSHDALFAIGFELAFVIVATIVAGISDNLADGMIGLMVLLIVLNGILNVDVFAEFVQSHPLTPTGRSTGTTATNTTIYA